MEALTSEHILEQFWKVPLRPDFGPLRPKGGGSPKILWLRDICSIPKDRRNDTCPVRENGGDGHEYFSEPPSKDNISTIISKRWDEIQYSTTLYKGQNIVEAVEKVGTEAYFRQATFPFLIHLNICVKILI